MTGEDPQWSLKDGRQRCRRINVYANVLEQPPLCAVVAQSDRFEREWIVEEEGREKERGSSYRRDVYFAAWLSRPDQESKMGVNFRYCTFYKPFVLHHKRIIGEISEVATY